MYSIERKYWGLHLTFEGFIRKEEMEQYLEELIQLIDSGPKTHGALVDLRELKVVPPESIPALEQSQVYAKNNGLTRSVQIHKTNIITGQLIRMSKETGVYEWERYLDSKTTPNWEELAIKWIVDGIDPDVSR